MLLNYLNEWKILVENQIERKIEYLRIEMAWDIVMKSSIIFARITGNSS